MLVPDPAPPHPQAAVPLLFPDRDKTALHLPARFQRLCPLGVKDKGETASISKAVRVRGVILTLWLQWLLSPSRGPQDSRAPHAPILSRDEVLRNGSLTRGGGHRRRCRRRYAQAPVPVPPVKLHEGE